MISGLFTKSKMAKHTKGKKKKTKKKFKSKVDKLTAINARSLSKAQKRHIKDFGELHPLDTRYNWMIYLYLRSTRAKCVALLGSCLSLN
jgi:hypothetical protein